MQTVDIWQEIQNHCDVPTQLSLSEVCHLFYRDLYIIELHILNASYECDINPRTLCRLKLTNLNIADNSNIYDLRRISEDCALIK